MQTGRRNSVERFPRPGGPPVRHISVPQERAASPATGLFKGVWGLCHQQADWTSRPRREVQFCLVGPTKPCLPALSRIRDKNGYTERNIIPKAEKEG